MTTELGVDISEHPSSGGTVTSALSAPQIRDRIKEFRRVRAGDLVPNPRNWRIHTKAQREALCGLLNEIGYADALLARELEDGRLMIIDGHLRAETTPEVEVPVLVLDVTEEEANKILLTLDPLAAMAESDTARIQSLLETVQTDSEAVENLLRQTAGERLWRIVHPDEFHEADISLERADELRDKWRTEIGQLWHIELHRLICGDSTDRAAAKRLWADDGRPVRMIWTDAPYGVSYGEKTISNSRHGHGRGRRPIENDSLSADELQKLFAAALGVAREHAMAGAVIYATVPSVFLKHFIGGLEDGGFTYRHCLIWVKQSFVLGRSDYHYQHEPILYGWLENGAHYFINDRTQSSVLKLTVQPRAPIIRPVNRLG